MYPDNTRRLSSHAIVLMLIAYLQHIGILPRLQSMPRKSEFDRETVYYQKQFYRKKHKVENGGAELVAE